MNDSEGLSDGLREHLRRMHGAGDLPSDLSAGAATSRGRGENPACGDVLELSGALDAAGRLHLAFRASACGAVLATASVLCEGVVGAELADARRFDLAAAVEGLGGLPRHRAHALRVVGRAFEQVLAGLGGLGG
ncbi:MAG: iron-sulfur cluster assembly scaffold protein [Planctomycetota bacterium]|jgi:NifU-like protein involved in Fe-S cluster formation